MNIYNVFDVKSHSKTKNDILEEIKNYSGWEYETTNFKGGYTSSISKTDWGLEPLAKTSWPYFLVKEDYFSFVNFLGEKYGHRGTEWKVGKQWFNQYNPHSGSDHPFHNHFPSSIACVYYVELYDKSLVTVLKDPETNEKVVPKVKEGQILTMDANIFHKSPRNFTATRKTVISFNILHR